MAKMSELDYENVAMLGSNIGVGNLAEVSTLNRLADEFGLDTISLGNVLGFALEASEKGLISEKIHWGNFEEIKTLVNDIAFRRDVGRVLAEGVRSAAKKIGGGSSEWAMHVKGLEVSAYDCHMAPAMALAYGTSSIGAHHKDAWVITWEIKAGRGNYDSRKSTFSSSSNSSAGVYSKRWACAVLLTTRLGWGWIGTKTICGQQRAKSFRLTN